MDILILLLLLQIKHWYSDFKIQTYAQTVRKGIYRDPIGISHTVDHIYTSLIVIFLFSFFAPISLCAVIPVVLIEGIIHYHIDWIKVHYGIKDHTKPLFWNQFGLDQLAHQATYLAMVWVLLVY